MHRLTGQIALAALLAFTLVCGTLLTRSTAEAQTAGAFVAAPIFDARGNAFAVFTGGSVANLEAGA